MKTKRIRPSQRKREAQHWDWTAEGLGLDPVRYQALLSYLFERPVPEGQQQEWYWADEHVPFEASALEWTRFQTAIFANAGQDLIAFGDEQVGMGLSYLSNNSLSDVPYAAVDPSVPIEEAMRMVQAMPMLWRDCFGQRLRDASPIDSPIGSGSGGVSGPPATCGSTSGPRSVERVSRNAGGTLAGACSWRCWRYRAAPYRSPRFMASATALIGWTRMSKSSGPSGSLCAI